MLTYLESLLMNEIVFLKCSLGIWERESLTSVSAIQATAAVQMRMLKVRMYSDTERRQV